MDRAQFDDYIARFNAQDMTAFDAYPHPDMRCLNGTLDISGVEGFKRHYQQIWSTFDEALTVERFIGDADTVAIRMWAHFTATRDDDASMFGSVRRGDAFDFRGVIIYELADGRFTDIQVAYNSFSSTTADGRSQELGVPH